MTDTKIYSVVSLGLLALAWIWIGRFSKYWHPVEMSIVQLLLLVGGAIFLYLNAKKMTLAKSLITAVCLGFLINVSASVIVTAVFTVDGITTITNMSNRPMKIIFGFIFVTINTPALYVCVLLAVLAHILNIRKGSTYP